MKKKAKAKKITETLTEQDIQSEIKQAKQGIINCSKTIDDISNKQDELRQRIKQALTKEEIKALTVQLDKFSMSFETFFWKKNDLQRKISNLAMKLPPKLRPSGYTYDKINLKTNKGYTDKEKEELMRLIDSV